jgi:very-short-patch-repair endonuclease
MSMRFPELLGAILPLGFYSDDRLFPFQAWAEANRFEYPIEAQPFLTKCKSAAEAFFARPFTFRDGIEYPRENVAIAGDHVLELQVPCAGYWIDAVISDYKTSLAIEIDGAAFHHRTKEQIAADYLRQRRIVLKKYTVVRFTAREVFADSEECWRQIEAILAARRSA